VACKICDWTRRLDFDRYYQSVKPSMRVATSFCQANGLKVSHVTIKNHIPHMIGLGTFDGRELAVDTIGAIADEYNIKLDPSSVDTAIEFQQQLLSEAITIAGGRCLNSAKNNTLDLRQVQAYSLLFGMWSKVVSLEQRINPDAAMATIKGHLGDIKQIEASEAVIDV
jgi:hypothetical protein